MKKFSETAVTDALTSRQITLVQNPDGKADMMVEFKVMKNGRLPDAVYIGDEERGKLFSLVTTQAGDCALPRQLIETEVGSSIKRPVQDYRLMLALGLLTAVVFLWIAWAVLA